MVDAPQCSDKDVSTNWSEDDAAITINQSQSSCASVVIAAKFDECHGFKQSNLVFSNQICADGVGMMLEFVINENTSSNTC